jgi:hypothetical protein
MSYTISTTENSNSYQAPAKQTSFISNFFNWAASQEKDHHIEWTGITLFTTAAVFFPLTMAFILFTSGGFGFIIAAMTALVMVVVLNLAAMPTRFTIPAFALAILIDVVVIISSLLLH